MNGCENFNVEGYLFFAIWRVGVNYLFFAIWRVGVNYVNFSILKGDIMVHEPGFYWVLFGSLSPADELGFGFDLSCERTDEWIQRYARCTHSVSVVPPAYYAHLAAFRARFYLEPDMPKNGSLPGGARTNHASNGSGVQPLAALKENVKKVMFYC